MLFPPLRTHAHSLGSVITGYKYKPETKEYIEIARGNPQWPQSFYPIEHNVTINQGDFLVARCTYDTRGLDKTTHIGKVEELWSS